MNKAGSIVVMIERIGPYHAARLSALAAHAQGKVAITALETTRVDLTYAWATVNAHEEAWNRMTLFDTLPQSPRALCFATWTALGRLRPSCVAVPGWSSVEAITALIWCRLRRVPLILMSDSTKDDEVRHPVKEWVKKTLVGMAGAGFVAGTRHMEYLRDLGMRPEKIFMGYDVVDNDHFKTGAARAHAKADDTRERLDLPANYFISVARYVPKKNISMLIDAYAQYHSAAGETALPLLLVGEGPLKADLENQIAAAKLCHAVLMRPFAQYEELPAYFGLATALVLPSMVDQWGLVINEAMAAGCLVLASSHCGAAPDMVIEAQTGFTFDPTDAASLARLITWVAENESEAARIAGAGSVYVGAFGLSDHAQGFARAACAAGLQYPSHKESEL